MTIHLSAKRGFAALPIIAAVAVLLAIGGYLASRRPVDVGVRAPDMPSAPVGAEGNASSSAPAPQARSDERAPKQTPPAPTQTADRTNQTRQENQARQENRAPQTNTNTWVRNFFSGGFISADARPEWEILTEKERARLPDCADTLMTVSPVPIDAITAIEPIGSSNPPEHTLASISSDTYIGVRGQGTTATTPLVAPGDMWIILIQPRSGVTQDPEDDVIKYAFCKDVYGVVDHVKTLSPQMRQIIDGYSCPRSGDKPGDQECPILVLEKISAGTPLGTVGRMQGNFNFGVWDLRITHSFASPGRHGFLTLHAACPFNYFASPLREQLEAKLDSTAAGNCGSVEHDIPGTLQGDWFIGDASPRRHADWDKLLYFGPHNRLAGQSVISASGIFVSRPTRWIFTAAASSSVNRKFSEVVPGAIYCYDNDGNHPNRNYEKGGLTGRILVELTGPTELQIEYQSGMCADGAWSFTSPTRYQR